MGFLMERYRKWLIFSIIFLAIALAFPIIALYLQSTSTLRAFESTIIQPNWEASSPETFDDMNVRAARARIFLEQQETELAQFVLIVVAIEAVLIVVFTSTLLYAIRCRDQCRSFTNPTRRI
jgi:hypothetical protein